MNKAEVVASEPVISIGNTSISLRPLTPSDLEEVKILCGDWFPVQYPNSWYEDITGSSRFFSLAAISSGHIIGLIVAEIRLKSNCNREEQTILDGDFPPTTRVVYILSLGVGKDFRCHGIASILLEELLKCICHSSHHDCKAVYLHVLTTNLTAIHFYERRKFQQHDYLPYYYSIDGSPKDGYCYVRYINGGYSPWSVIDYIKQVSASLCKLEPCALPRRMWHGFGNWFRRMLPHITASCHSCIPTFTNLDSTMT